MGLDILDYFILLIGVYASIFMGVLGKGISEYHFTNKVMSTMQVRILYFIFGVTLIVLVALGIV